MFSELIYTRCRQGIDILKSGRTITSDGFKVYSCTPSLLSNENTDLQLLFTAAQSKQPYNDPAFMNDAYLYFVPDKGERFMVNFHPVQYDPTATGDYSHRAGNFVNQILVGDYSSFYPFELFGDETVWNAKARGEAFYYEKTPTALPVRTDVEDPVGEIHLDDLAAFVSDGRKDALMAAVSFLIAQYEMPPENRKFLLIRDESSANIEKWIAAIEHAFSPRIAASIPFASRLDKFATANRYTVNQSGVYQTQINLQDPNQKLRYRAMIVGVDERDRTNISAARPLANSPFVLLDGKEKRAMFEANTSHRYHRFITNFDNGHQIFCREFLQMLDIKAPSSDLYNLFDIYATLQSASSLPNAEKTAGILSVLSKYDLFNCSQLKSIYNCVTDTLPRFLQENVHTALQIVKWLQSVSRVVGDAGATQRLTEIVCTAFTDQVYKKSDAKGSLSFWKSIKSSAFATDAARYFVAQSTLQTYGSDLQKFMSPDDYTDGIVFAIIYLECSASIGSVSAQDLTKISDYGLKLCAPGNDLSNAQNILLALSYNKQISVQDILLAIAKGANAGYAEFIIKLLIETDNSIVASDASIIAFYDKLRKAAMEQLFVPVLKYRIRTLSKPSDIEQFIKLVKKVPSLNNNDLTEIFETLDHRLVVADKGSVGVALSIQQEKPQGARCINSAHLYAFEVLSDKSSRKQFTKIYNDVLIPQGFPSAQNSSYVVSLIERLFKSRMEQHELTYAIQLFARVPSYIAELVGTILARTTAKQSDEWNTLITVAAKTKNRAIYDAIIESFAVLKQGEKALSQFNDMLGSREARDYFRHITEDARDVIRSQKPQSGLGRLFNKLSGADSDDDSRRKK